MKFFTALLALATSVSAAAIQPLEKRVPPGSTVRLCIDVDYRYCYEQAFSQGGACTNLVGTVLHDSITSMQIPNGWTCAFYVHANCPRDARNAVEVYYYKGNVPNVGSLFNDKFSSFYCYSNI